MKLTNQFTVAASLDKTWVALLDIRRVALCLPGATIEGDGEDGSYRGRIQVKLGPIKPVYIGTVRLSDIDESGHRATMEVVAKELRGPGTATARIHSALSTGQGGGTVVVVETELDITGRPAQLGRGIIESVARSLMAEFAAGLEAELRSTESGATSVEAPTAASGNEVLDLGTRVWRPLVARGGAALVAALVIVVVVARGRRHRH